jgi:hypothetical protein
VAASKVSLENFSRAAELAQREQIDEDFNFRVLTGARGQDGVYLRAGELNRSEFADVLYSRSRSGRRIEKRQHIRSLETRGHG